ncbi:hypothetical protein JB92DRAFT_3087230 [Gautieria morchelliformis]|nr:hypothetical protein JB92DRAFT_3087230 [Gautieria morchelliformis]
MSTTYSTMPGLSFGSELPDNVDKISSISDVQLGLLSDLREIFRERVVLEKEYASKLQVLAKKAGEKKARRISKLVLGDDPTQVWTEETVRLSTFDGAYSKLLSSLESGAQDHFIFADALSSQVTEELKKLERKHEEAKKKQTQFFEKLLADKDRTASDRSKVRTDPPVVTLWPNCSYDSTQAKHKYDEECMEMASYQHKQDRATDDKHTGRAAKQLEQQKIEMLNGKNAYLISLTIFNNAKNKFYEQDLPLLENQYQSIQTHLITSLTTILQHSQSLLATHLASLQSRANLVDTALSQVNPAKDQDLFIEYNRNLGGFKVPDDLKFEPCEGFYDTGELNVESAPKVFLQNKLSRCRSKLKELEPVLHAKKQDAEKLEGLVSAYTQDRTLGNLEEVRENCFEAQQQLTYLSTSQSMLTAEIEVILMALGDDQGAQRPHSFKSSSFSIPTPCGYCKTSIWGLTKQGKTCKCCGLSVHSRCELKLPAECSGGNSGGHVRSSASISMSPVPSHQPAKADHPSASSFSTPHAAHEETHPSASVLFSYEASSPFELSVTAGELVQLLEVDDGSGWIKIADSQGSKGLVPASYVEPSDAEGAHAPSPTLETPPQDAGVYVRALYVYESQGPDELSLHEGETIKLTSGPNGGQNYADGWWEGIHPSGRKGIFPSNYVELV